ncbi:MAG: dTMP kinase [Gammaproteobacteria bacterium]|nr:dTMP kinase [Gammaproteobacteria bacterium]NDG44445.1 dTMP kinase [Gammaproteobacteria bacterium]
MTRSTSKLKGRFITFEGSDGAGKTTQINQLHARLKEAGVACYLTREPGGTAIAERIRDLVLLNNDPRTAITELLLIFAARAEHTSEVILPSLKSGQWVLCDRYTDASYAYQGGGSGVPEELIAKVESVATGGLKPDLTILLDIETEEGALRLDGRASSPDRFEAEAADFKRRVREAYLKRQANEPNRIHRINALGTVESIGGRIFELVKPLLAESYA